MRKIKRKNDIKKHQTIKMSLTSVEFLFCALVLEWLVEQMQVHFDGTSGGFEVKRVATQHVLQPEQPHVRSEGHLAHAVRVEVELVFDDLRKMLKWEEKQT